MKKLRRSWLNLDHAVLHLVPQVWQDWLSYPFSLTQYVERRTQKSVSVQVLTDKNQLVLNDEQDLFQRSFSRCRVREVYLCIDDIPVVFARSILPTSSSTGINRDLLQIGNRPLGEVLFKNGKAPILLRQITEIAHIGFGRRTLYQLRGHPILISEFFLPALLEKIVE
jgi:chorismate--pyruvate lyase